jgi:Protein kinase domain
MLDGCIPRLGEYPAHLTGVATAVRPDSLTPISDIPGSSSNHSGSSGLSLSQHNGNPLGKGNSETVVRGNPATPTTPLLVEPSKGSSQPPIPDGSTKMPTGDPAKPDNVRFRVQLPDDEHFFPRLDRHAWNRATIAASSGRDNFPARPPPPLKRPNPLRKLRKIKGASGNVGYTMEAREFASGGEGKAHRMTDPDGEAVIVKEPMADSRTDSNRVARLTAEAAVLKRLEEADDKAVAEAAQANGGHAGFQDLDHREYFPHRVEFIEKDPNDPEDVPLIVMRMFSPVPGRIGEVPSLKDRLQSRTPKKDGTSDPDGKPNDPVLLNKASQIFLVRQLVKAYERMHSVHVIQRDGKPGNVLVDSPGNTKVIDMGFASIDGKPWVGHKEGAVAGTKDYMSPEQMEDGPITVKDDLYALRKMVWEILAYAEAPDPISDLPDHQKPISSGKFRRFYYWNGNTPVFATELKYAPEFKGVNRRLAFAAWGKWAQSVEEYGEGINKALDTRISEAQFFKEMFEKISAQDPGVTDLALYQASRQKVRKGSARIKEFETWYVKQLEARNIKLSQASDPFPQAPEAVVSILGDLEAIARFPDGLTEEKRDAVIRAAYASYAATEKQRGPDGRMATEMRDMPFLHWEPFFKRVKRLGLNPNEYKTQNRINDEIRLVRESAED